MNVDKTGLMEKYGPFELLTLGLGRVGQSGRKWPWGRFLPDCRRSHKHENVLVGTTGSVIYAGDGLLKRLSRLTTVVPLPTPPRVQERFFR